MMRARTWLGIALTGAVVLGMGLGKLPGEGGLHPPALPARAEVEEVVELYHSLLCREPDDAELQAWLESGLSGEELQAAISASPDGQRTAAIRAQYLALLNRDPIPVDCEGVRSWVVSEAPLADVRRLLLESQKYRASEGNPAGFFARFDPARGQLPEGIVAEEDGLYLSFAPTSEILRVSYLGVVNHFAQLPQGPPGQVFALGMAFDRARNLYVALTSQAPQVIPGIYRIPRDGLPPSLFATHEELLFPNDLTFDAAGNLFFTDSLRGAIYRVTPQRQVSRWLQHPLLEGDLGACPGVDLPFPVGANGIAFDVSGNLLVANTTKALILRVRATAAGITPEVVAGPDCSRLLGADGLALDRTGAIYVAANTIRRLSRVGPDGNVTVIESGLPLDFPSTLAFGSGLRDRTLFITNFGLSTGSTWPSNPGLLSKEMGVAGKPLLGP